MVPGSVVESAGLRRSARVTKKRIEDLSVILLEDDTEDDEEWEMRPGRTSGRTRRNEGTISKTSVRDKDMMKPLESVEEEPPTAQAMAREIEVLSLSDSRWSILSSFLLFLSVNGFCKHWIFCVKYCVCLVAIAFAVFVSIVLFSCQILFPISSNLSRTESGS